ncbi:MAG: hypothetical protein GKR94_17335 [Gammaproteobacteria bacterium]|nr:hypothetical protein [Gammaproteobacteria bacterium]
MLREDQNLVQAVRRSHVDNGRTRFLTSAERRTLLEACREESKGIENRLYWIMVTAIYTGVCVLRPSRSLVDVFDTGAVAPLGAP